MPILYYALNLRASGRREAQVRAGGPVAHRCAHRAGARGTLLQRLDSAAWRGRSAKHACALLGVRIANLEAIADEFGQRRPTRLLVVAASLCGVRSPTSTWRRASANGVRLAARGPSAREMRSRAQQVVASGLRSRSKRCRRALTLKFHVPSPLLPDPRWTPNPPSLGAGRARQIPPNARKMIRPLNF